MHGKKVKLGQMESGVPLMAIICEHGIYLSVANGEEVVSDFGLSWAELRALFNAASAFDPRFAANAHDQNPIGG